MIPAVPPCQCAGDCGKQRPIGICPHQGMDNGCHFGAPCKFQHIDYSVPIGIGCGREAAILAELEQAEGRLK